MTASVDNKFQLNHSIDSTEQPTQPGLPQQQLVAQSTTSVVVNNQIHNYVNNIYITTNPMVSNAAGEFSAIIGDEPMKKKRVVKKKKGVSTEK